VARKVYEISFQIAGRLASSFRGAFASASTQLSTLGQQTKQLKTGLRELEAQHKKGVIAADAYKAAHQRLTQQLEKTQRIQERLSQSQQRLNELHSRSAQIRGQIVDTAALAAPFVYAAKAAMDFETAMLGVAKQVQGARDENGNLTSVYYDMRKQIQLLGREIPMATNEIAAMVEAGARMDIPKEQLIDYAREVAKMATAFEMAPDVIGEQMGKVAKVMGIPIPEIGDLADTINYLDDNAIAKGADIIEVLQRVGGTAKQVGLSAHQTAALASTFLTLGKSAEVAATASNALIRELTIAQMQPERFQEGLKALGMTAEEVNKGMVTDAQGTILKILDAINSLDKARQTEVTTSLFGKEYGDDIAALAGAIDEYRRQLGLLNDEQRKGSMDREFQAKLQSTAAQMQLLRNSATEAAVAFGDIFLPRLNAAAQGIAVAAQGAAEFAQKYPGVTNAILTGIGGLIAARIAWLALKFVWNQGALAVEGLKKAYLRLTAQQTIATNKTVMQTAVTKSLTVAQRALNLAMRMNPIGMVITAIGGLIAVGVYLYQNIESVRKAVNGLWDAFKSVFPGAAALAESLGRKIAWLVEKFRGLSRAQPSGELTQRLSRANMIMPAYARGGIVTRPHVGMVGEEGPEAIIPLDRSQRALSLWQRAGEALGVRGGENVTYNITFAPVINGAGPEVMDELKRQKDDFVEKFKAFEHQRRRLAFDG